ncbi:MAG: hypothetical protein BJ554DRAFT_4918 [Olpidium bornovanus]|uniref:Uncharacterized protein n=1 Tax=Olpidium bornovanus TaxID=278681 RepID=A0A8H7ZM39_9FUNG|nr:MAG: hypothetical protein BJ554DRAFT_4918 [Olpidium bornovanus]
MSKSRAAAGGDTDDESEANGPVSSFQSLAAEADILAKQGDYRKAIDAFTKVSLPIEDRDE